jgi:hypothetical protein
MSSSVSAGPLTYDVVPMTPTQDAPSASNYVMTGTITTDGKLGGLQPADVIDWSISLDGPQPFLFSPSNPGASVGPNLFFLRATDTSLNVVAAQFLRFAFFAADNSDPNCSHCQQVLRWGYGGSGVWYTFGDSFDYDPSVGAYHDYGGVMPIIAIRIPEPSSWALAATAAMGIGWQRRSKKIITIPHGS